MHVVDLDDKAIVSSTTIMQ